MKHYPLLFLFFSLGLMFFPLCASAKSTELPVRISFEISVIEAAKSMDIRLGNGLENLVSDVCAIASTQPKLRFSSGLEDFKAGLISNFPDHRSFKFVSESAINLSEHLFGELVITDDPVTNLHLSYLGRDAKADLHNVVLKLNDQLLPKIGLKLGEVFFQVGIPYGKGTLILAITLTDIHVPR